MRIKLAVAATALVALIVAAGAIAATPIKGATYKGSVHPKSIGDSIQFKVSKNGKKVSGFTVSFAPIGCQGADPQVASGGSASISKGKFKVSLTMYFPPTQPSRHVGTLIVKGAFAKHGKEAGTVTSKFSGQNGFNTSCDTKDSYGTKG